MDTDIPNIAFRTKYPEIKGIEILTIENLLERKKNLDHDPERPHQLEFYLLAYYTRGVSKQLVDFAWHEVKANSIIYLLKGQINAFNFKKDLKGYVLLFTESYFNERLNHLPKDTGIRLFTSHLFSPKIEVPESSSIGTYIQLLYNEFYKEDSAYNKKNIIDYLYNILFSKLERLKQYQTRHLKDSGRLTTFLRFKSALERNFHKSRNADYYATQLGISYKHLNEICKELINLTAKQFIDEFIILKAKRSLVNSSIKSTQLAFSMGFEESSNFVKYFKKHTGLTPNRFKKNS